MSGGIASDFAEGFATDDLCAALSERRADGACRLWQYDSGAITMSAESSGRKPMSKRRQRNQECVRDDFTEPSNGRSESVNIWFRGGSPDREFSSSLPGEVLRLKAND
jgi:hypothetical protein